MKREVAQVKETKALMMNDYGVEVLYIIVIIRYYGVILLLDMSHS